MSRKELSGLNMTGTPIDNLPDAVSDQQPATFGQLNAAITGRKWKDSVRAASTGNLTLSGLQTVDGISLIAGNRCLAKDQTTALDRGIYIVASGAWTRATDFDADSEIASASVLVEEGTVNADTQWTCTTNNPIVIGVTSLTFVQTGTGGTTYTGGNGITIAGTVVAVDPAVVAHKAGANIGNGASTTIAVTHNLGSTDVVVLVQEVSSKAKVECDVVMTDSNTVTLTFAVAPTTNQYRVTVIG